MSASQISRAARVEIETRLAANFNSALAAACAAYGVGDQVFTIDWTPGANYFRAPYTLTQFRETVALEVWPVMTLSTLSAVDRHEVVGPTKFQGPVELQIGTYLVFDGRAPGDLESLAEAVESAIVDALNVTPFVGSVSPPVQGTWRTEKPEPEFQDGRWFVPLIITFQCEVTA